MILSDAEQALQFISPDISRDDWAQIGMSLKSEFGDAGFALFDAWSSCGENYNQADCKATWRSVRAGGGRGIGSLIFLAKQNGWVPGKSSLSDSDRRRLQKEQDTARAQRAKEIERDKALEAEWREINAQAAQRIGAECLALEGRSDYLQHKKVCARGIRFVRQGFVALTHFEAKRIDLVRGKADLDAFFRRLKAGEIDRAATSFKYVRYGTIAIPLCDLNQKLWSWQFIEGKGGKQFLKFSRKRGLHHLLSDPNDLVPPPSSNSSVPAPAGLLLKPDTPLIAFAEGYSSAATVHMAMRWPVVMAIDSGNLRPVCEAFRAVYPNADFVICGDDDGGKKVNAGRKAATSAADAVNGRVVFPDFSGVAV